MNMSRWSLDRLISWIGTAAAFVLFVPTSAYLVRDYYSSAERSLLERGSTYARGMTGQIVDPLLVGDRLRSHDILARAALADEDIAYICVESTRGEVVADTFHRVASGSADKATRRGDGCPSSLAALWAESPGEVLRFRTSEGPMLDVPAPILEGQLGSLHVGLRRDGAVRAVRRLMWPMGVSLSAGLFVILVGAQLVAAKVSQPLQRLEEEVSRVPANAGEGEPPKVSGTREVESLAEGFAKMSGRLRELERERESAQRHMVRAERMAALGGLAAGLAHEVRNPLDGMLECVRSLEADPKNEDHVARYLPMLRDGLQRIASVMQQVLVFTRSGHDAPSEACSAALIVDSVVLMLQGKLVSRGVRLATHGSGPCECLCNPQGLAQALLNLVLNAVEAAGGHDKPHVLVTVEGNMGNERWVRLTVEDTGPGVPDELRERVFEPFFTTKPIGEGTGLGLSISRELMRAVGGELVLSRQPSPLGGARFVIRVPAASEPEFGNERA